MPRQNISSKPTSRPTPASVTRCSPSGACRVAALKQIPLPGSLPFKVAPALDGFSLAYAVVLGTGCGIAFGLVPAWQLARGDVLQALRSGRGSVAGRSRIRDFLVGVQVAV